MRKHTHFDNAYVEPLKNIFVNQNLGIIAEVVEIFITI